MVLNVPCTWLGWFKKNMEGHKCRACVCMDERKLPCVQLFTISWILSVCMYKLAKCSCSRKMNCDAKCNRYLTISEKKQQPTNHPQHTTLWICFCLMLKHLDLVSSCMEIIFNFISCFNVTKQMEQWADFVSWPLRCLSFFLSFCLSFLQDEVN